MLLARHAAAALRPGALRGLSQQGQSGRIFAARVAGAHRPQALVRHRSSDSGIVQSVLRHLSTAAPDDGGQAQGHPRDGRPSLFSKKAVDFAAVLEEYEHPTPARISQKNQRRRFSEFSNETLAVMASLGVHGASKERMLREIMRVDGCSYVEAYAVLAKMNLHLEGGTSLHKLPYQAIIAGAWALGVVLIPLGVFQKDLAIWFATVHVGVELPPAEEIDTVWKVGTWTWQWMEPIIGTWSFVLLALQLIRANGLQIDAKPFNERILTARADDLYKQFPEYEREIVRDYSKSDPFGRDTYRARLGYPANSVLPLNRFSR
jgi:hypothetical protein